ncbi:MAG: bile acid:sodium symporter [Devosia sp.]|nr:bile acid:sodium symporter [Devosia sp.]
MLDRMRRLFDPYIVLMIVTVGIAAIEPARGRGAPVAGAAADAGIIFLFFLYGARLSPSAAFRGLRHWRLHLTVLLSTFVVFPALGVALRS